MEEVEVGEEDDEKEVEKVEGEVKKLRTSLMMG